MFAESILFYQNAECYIVHFKEGDINESSSQESISKAFYFDFIVGKYSYFRSLFFLALVLLALLVVKGFPSHCQW